MPWYVTISGTVTFKISRPIQVEQIIYSEEEGGEGNILGSHWTSFTKKPRIDRFLWFFGAPVVKCENKMQSLFKKIVESLKHQGRCLAISIEIL